MSVWASVSLGELVEVKGGKRLPLGHKLQIEKNNAPYIRIVDFDGGIIDQSKMLFVPTQTQPLIQRYRVARGDVFISIVGTVGVVGVIPKSLDGAFLTENAAKLTSFEPVLNASYLSYVLRSSDGQNSIREQTVGSTQPKLALHRIREISIPLPPIDVQKAIAEVLGALDDKIAANTKIIALLDSHTSLEYSAAIAEASHVTRLEEVAHFHNKKRIPLSAPERDARPGSVPYYGASGIFGNVDEALFDAPLVLVGEDGSVVKDDGTAVIQYIWGPSWVNNHAHVLTGAGISTELLYVAIKREQVTMLVTGAVQPKINMGNLKRLQLTIPNAESLKKIEALVNAETASKRGFFEENRTLAATRDAFLPQLMSGKLRVRDAEIAVQAVV